MTYRELAAPQTVDDGPSTFVCIQNRVMLFAIQLDTALIIPARTDE